MRNIQAKQGEGLLELAIRGYDSILSIFDMAVDNDVAITDPLEVGSLLNLPLDSPIGQGKVYRIVEEPIEIKNPPKMVTVLRGESLYDLAVSQLGDITRVYDLALENNIEAHRALGIGDPIYYPNERPNKVVRELFGKRPATAWTDTIPVILLEAVDDLAAIEITHNSISIGWTAPSATYAIDYYEIYVDDELLTTTPNLTFLIEDLAQETEYSIKLKTVDVQGNISEFSNEINPSTIVEIFTFSSFNISRRFTFVGSDVGRVAPPASNEKIGILQLLSGANYRSCFLNGGRTIDLDSGTGVSPDYDTNNDGNVGAFFTTYTAQIIRLSHWYCEVTGFEIKQQGSTDSPYIKAGGSSDFVRENGSPVIIPVSQSFGRMQGYINTTTAFSELNNGNSFTITVIGKTNDLDYENWGFCSEYNAGNNITLDKILVGLSTKATKKGAIIKAGGVEYALTFINRIQDGNRHTISLTVNGGTKLASLYLDGVFQSSITFSGTYLNNAVAMFTKGGNGTGGASNINWKGYFKGLEIASIDLNATQIANYHDLINNTI